MQPHQQERCLASPRAAALAVFPAFSPDHPAHRPIGDLELPHAQKGFLRRASDGAHNPGGSAIISCGSRGDQVAATALQQPGPYGDTFSDPWPQAGAAPGPVPACPAALNMPETALPPERIIRDSSAAIDTVQGRIDSWRRGVQSVMFDPKITREQGRNFNWHAESHHFGTVVCGTIGATPHEMTRTASELPGSNTDHLLITIARSAGLVVSAAGREQRLDVGDIALLDVAQPSIYGMTAATSDTVEASWMVVPRVVLEKFGEVASLHGKVVPTQAPINRMVTSHLACLLECSPSLAPNEVDIFGNATAAMLPHYLSTLMGERDLGRVPSGAMLSRICMYIERHLLSRRLSVTALCSEFAMSRSALYRLFEPLGGISAYVRQQKLARARRMLVDPACAHLKVLDIAHKLGYTPAAFITLFRQVFGMTPQDARLAQGLPVFHEDDSQVEWIRQL